MASSQTIIKSWNSDTSRNSEIVMLEEDRGFGNFSRRNRIQQYEKELLSAKARNCCFNLTLMDESLGSEKELVAL